MAREDQDVGVVPALRSRHVRLRVVQLWSPESGQVIVLYSIVGVFILTCPVIPFVGGINQQFG